MTPAQKAQLVELIERYVGNMDDGHARLRMDEVRRHLDDTWFAWIGGTSDDAVFYYRIQSPVVLIEFDHQVPVGTRNVVANPKAPHREHVHTVIRTPNGNDYGKDLLKQHHERHPAPASDGVIGWPDWLRVSPSRAGSRPCGGRTGRPTARVTRPSGSRARSARGPAARGRRAAR